MYATGDPSPRCEKISAPQSATVGATIGRGSLVTGVRIGRPALCGPCPRTNGSEELNMTIRNPIEWGADTIRLANEAVEATGRAVGGDASLPTIRRIGIGDLRQVLARGFDDFATYRTDVIFICAVYPLAGLFLARLAFGYEMLPLLFPIASGFALIGPVAAVGLYEMSRRREQGAEVTWAEAFGVVRSPSFGAIVVLGLLLMTVFLVWLAV